MRQLFYTLIIVFVSNFSFSQTNKGLCKVEVDDVSKVTSFGYLLGYSVTFKNDTNKTIDGIYWNVYYYNNANELLKKDNSSFNSTKLIDPIASGFTKTIARSPKVKGASVVIIKITKVHFSDGTSCDKYN
jgi:hypothetical protein